MLGFMLQPAGWYDESVLNYGLFSVEMIAQLHMLVMMDVLHLVVCTLECLCMLMSWLKNKMDLNFGAVRHSLIVVVMLMFVEQQQSVWVGHGLMWIQKWCDHTEVERGLFVIRIL